MSFIAGYLLGLEENSAEPVIQSLTATENKTYNAPEGVDGYDPVIVNVPTNTGGKTITSNGTYYAADDGLAGFDVVTVNVPYEELYEYAMTGGSDNVTDDGQTVPDSMPSGDSENTNRFLEFSHGEFNTVTNMGNSVQATVFSTNESISGTYYVARFYCRLTDLSTGVTNTVQVPDGGFGWLSDKVASPSYRITGVSSSTIYYTVTVPSSWGGETQIIDCAVPLTVSGAGSFSDDWLLSKTQI